MPSIHSLNILVRRIPDDFAPPAGVRQVMPGSTRIAYIVRALLMGLGRKGGILFCGHIHLAPLAALVARMSRAQLIVQLHGVEAWQRPGRLQRRAVEAASLILCVSRYTRTRLLQWADVSPERALVVSNTVNPIFSPGSTANLRATWNLEGKTVLLTVARMDARERYKGHERIIAALPELDAKVVYVVLGEGDDADRLKRFAAEKGVSARVLFKGAVSRETLVEAYRMADLFVMPSTGEGFGIAFLEAMACGTPALGLAIAGATDALVDGELGIAAKEEEFAGELKRLLADAKKDEAILAESVRSRFGRETFVRSVHNALNRLLAA